MSAVHVTVRVGSELYALPVETVLEVADVGRLTFVPGARPGTLGLQNLRGSALPIFDLAAVLGVSGDERRSRLVVTESRGRKAGLAVDEVRDVGSLPDAGDETDSPLLTRAALADTGLIGVLDLDALLDTLQGAA
jgi:purine-binding chemotaxis protein CheW